MIKFCTSLLMLLAASAASASMADHATRTSVDGIDLITFHTEVQDVVEITGSLPAGNAFAGAADAAVPTLTGMMLDRGTRTLDKFAIAKQLEEVGADISFSVGTQTLQFQARCLKKDLALVIGLIAAELRTPAFSPQEFLKAKQQLQGNLQNSLQSTDARAHEAYSHAVYPEGHPNRGHTTEEALASVKSAQLRDVKAFHEKYYGPAHMTLILVGDVTKAAAESEAHRAFAGWSGGVDFLHAPAPTAATVAAEVKVPLADKPSVSILLGQRTGLRYRDPDALALRVGTAILGYGFTGRLMSVVRDKEGLTYGIGAGMGEDSLTDGVWTLSASFAPALLDKGMASSRRELLRWWTDGITDKELEERKQGLIGAYLVGLSTTAGVAGAIQSAVQRGYDLTWLDQYPDAVKALTREKINAAIQAHLNPNALLLVEAGSLPGAAP